MTVGPSNITACFNSTFAFTKLIHHVLSTYFLHLSLDLDLQALGNYTGIVQIGSVRTRYLSFTITN